MLFHQYFIKIELTDYVVAPMPIVWAINSKDIHVIVVPDVEHHN